MRFYLHLFAPDGGAAEGAATSSGDQTAAGNTRQGNSGDFSDNAQAAAGQEPEVKVTSNTLEDKRKSYQELIRGEYKDLYAEDTQRLINQRFKETKALQAQVDEVKPLLDELNARYGTTDVKGILQAIEKDNGYWESAAEEAGMEVEQYKKIKTLERQNAALMEAQKQQAEKARVQEQVGRWVQEAETLKGKYPGFDLQTELADDQFRRLLQAGTPVEHAYRVIHMDELMSGAVSAAAAAAEKNVTDNIRAKGMRPVENGVAAQSGFVSKTDVNKLTKADRAEMARRAARGELISM